MTRSRPQNPKPSSATEKPIGRPPGSPNIKTEVDVAASHCAKCGSTDRSDYFGVPQVQEFKGLHDGRPFTHIVRRRCKCASCGQTRIDRTHENRKT